MKTKNLESYSLVGGKKCNELIAAYPDYKVFWRSGFAYRGAREGEDDKTTKPSFVIGGMKVLTFAQRMQQRYDWAAAIDVDVDHDAKEIHMNGFSVNDLY